MGTIGNGEPLRILCLSSELLIQIRDCEWNSFREDSGILPLPLRQTLRSKCRCLAGREYMGHRIFLKGEFIHGGKCQTLEKLFVPWKFNWFERLREDPTSTASPAPISDLCYLFHDHQLCELVFFSVQWRLVATASQVRLEIARDKWCAMFGTCSTSTASLPSWALTTEHLPAGFVSLTFFPTVWAWLVYSALVHLRFLMILMRILSWQTLSTYCKD